MKLISHRGNVNGRFESHENEPNYIDIAIKSGYDVEVDVWCNNDMLYLGHDKPEYGIDFRWFRDRIIKLWVHCKDLDSLYLLNNIGYGFNYFYHDKDDFTLTSTNNIWTYPGKILTPNSICVLPEQSDYSMKQLSECYGICSDNIEMYKNELKL